MNLTYSFILSALLALITLKMQAQTKIIAHRGFSGVAPENTLIAFQKAIDCGADYFELDIQKTKNDSIVVIHDGSVDRTSSNAKTGLVSEMTYQELIEIKVGHPTVFESNYENERIPTLRESLLLAKGKIKVCIEIKIYGVEKEILKIVKDLGMEDEVIVFSFYYPVIAKIRKLNNSIKTLYLMNTADLLTIDYASVIESNAVGVGAGTEITKEYLDIAHSYGIEVWKWTVDNEDHMQELLDLGIDGLITNYPDKALIKRSDIKK
jgi:glycerophosphoryl diester phosphodiesterase